MKFLVQSCFILMFLVGNINSEAQNRKVLVEHFTNTKCPICKSNNPGFYTRYNKYKENAIHIAIHPSVPYNSCALYLANVPGNSARQNNYDLFGTPTAYLDGKSGGSNLPSEAEYMNAISKPANYELKFIDPNPSQVRMEIKTLNSLPSGASIKLYVALTEKDLEYNAPNGEQHHYDVFRKFLDESNDGIQISFPAGANAGDVISYSFGQIDYPVSNYNDYNLISFLQSNSSTEILQAEITAIGPGASISHVNFNNIKLNSYPNPVVSTLNIDWQNDNFKPQSIEIFNENGQLVNKTPVRIIKNKTTIQIDQLSQGLYLFKLIGDNNSFGYGKFIVK
jgi:hypothetical protein